MKTHSVIQALNLRIEKGSQRSAVHLGILIQNYDSCNSIMIHIWIDYICLYSMIYVSF